VVKGFQPLVELGRLFRFGIVGIAATLVYAGATLFAIEIFHLAPVPSSIFGQLTATGVSYFGHSIFSFAVQTDHKTYLTRFLLLLLLTFALNAIVTWLLSDVLQISHRISVAVVTVLIPVVNFISNRYWVFLPGLQTTTTISGAPGRPTTNRQP
jgi:putative flippase GtrA